MAYCDWAEVQKHLPRASDIVSAGADQTEVLNSATKLTDAHLAGVVRVPVQQEGGAYDELVVMICALFASHLVGKRRHDSEGDSYEVDYGGTTLTGTRFFHEAMGIIQAMRQAKAFTEGQVTEADLSIPLVETSWSTTNGTVEARFITKRYLRTAPAFYVFTIESSGGTVAGDSLTFSCKRDNDEEIILATSPKEKEVLGTDWINIEYGLQVRFLDADSAPVWTEDETFKITCEPLESIKASEGVREVELLRG